MNKLMKKFSKKQKIFFIIMLIISLILLILIGYKLLSKFVFTEDNPEEDSVVEIEGIDNDIYNYYITNRATDYQKGLFEELETVLSAEEIDNEKYATVLTKLFISDLFTLSNKKSSSDITSSQYVYGDYQDTFETMVKDTIYSNIELNIDQTREQKLPVVKDVLVNSIEKKVFKYNDEVLDNEALYFDISIEYEEDLEYPTAYEVVLVKNGDLLEIVKLSE